MASRVFSKRFESCPTGSLPVRARRMRAVICFQSAIQWLGVHCNSGRGWLPAARPNPASKERQIGTTVKTAEFKRPAVYVHDAFYSLTEIGGLSILLNSPLGDSMARLRDRLREVFVVIVSISLVTFSTHAASSIGLGTVVSAERAHVGRAAASIGTTVFN